MYLLLIARATPTDDASHESHPCSRVSLEPLRPYARILSGWKTLGVDEEAEPGFNHLGSGGSDS
jgi:hypothetical protein